MKGNCRAALCHPTRRADRSQCERSMSPPSHSPRAPRGVREGVCGGGDTKPRALRCGVVMGKGHGVRIPPPAAIQGHPPTPHPSACRAAPAAPLLPYQCFCSTGCGTRTHTCAPECTRGGQRARGCAQSAMHGSGSAVSIAQPCVRRTPHTAPPLCSPACTAGPHTRVCNAQTELWGGGGWMCVGGGGSGGDSGGTGSSPGATSNLVCRRRR